MKQNKLNVAVIGASKMARRHLDGLLRIEKAHIYAICDPARDARLDKCIEAYKPDRAVKDYKELLGDPKIDVVIVVTPDQVHKEITEAFLNDGKHVLCEKPMALSVEECVSMIETEKKSGKRLMIGQVSRYTANFAKTKELIDTGEIGELFYIETEYAHSYLHNPGYGNWRDTPERDGFIGGGCHAVDFARWIAGDPIEVYALANHKCLTEWPANDATVALYKFPNNVMGRVFASVGCVRPYTMRSVFYGNKGTIICDNRSEFITLYNTKQGRDKWEAQDGGERIPVPRSDHNTYGECTDFINAILDGTDTPIKSEDGAKTVIACLAAVQSARENKPIIIDYPEIIKAKDE